MFHEKLLALRKKHAWSQETLAEKLGVSRQTVAKWESGESVPDLTMASAISALFGVSLDSLSGRTGVTPAGKYAFGAVKLGERGQLVLPKKCREIFGLEAGDLIMVLGDVERGIAMMKVTPEMFRVFDDDGLPGEDEV
ncbi:MAG: helix-turn-helix domain-containing protein [Clostridia bacterium]|nr:helix-turn-helix domain-containing protein [Clostridia bacterium]